MEKEDMHQSLFEYLFDRYGNKISVLLKRQYRMNGEIAEFPNQTFYNNKLENADRNEHWKIEGLNPIIGIDIKGEEEQHSGSYSYHNKAESQKVVDHVRLLSNEGVSLADIGVITAYRGQAQEIKSTLGSTNLANDGEILVDTVDSFQGGEREAIIVSFVRSNSERNSGFLEKPDTGPRRLNVALTRARKRLVLIGDWDTLSIPGPHRTETDSCAHIYAELSEYLRSNERMG